MTTHSHAAMQPLQKTDPVFPGLGWENRTFGDDTSNLMRSWHFSLILKFKAVCKIV
jgi:hypothetical protein